MVMEDCNKNGAGASGHYVRELDIGSPCRVGRRAGVPINKLYNARMSNVCMVYSLGHCPKKTRKRAGGTGVLHDFYTIISLSSLGKGSICRVRVV